jgi:hypothetical protein
MTPEEAIVEAAAELTLEAYCDGPRFGRNTAHMIAARRRDLGTMPTATAYRCPARGNHYHVGPTPSPDELDSIARAIRGLPANQPGNTPHT